MSSGIMAPVHRVASEFKVNTFDPAASPGTCEEARADSARPRSACPSDDALQAHLHNVHNSEACRAERDVHNTTLSRSLPKSVRACNAGKLGQPGAWSLALKGRVGGPAEGQFKAVRYECRSWRCTCQCLRRVKGLPKELRATCACCSCTNAKILFARLKSSFDRTPEWW